MPNCPQMRRPGSAADAAALSHLASAICRRLDAWREDGPSAPPPHLVAELSAVSAALTTLSSSLDSDGQKPTWILDCSDTLLHALERGLNQHTLPHHPHLPSASDVEQPEKAKATSWTATQKRAAEDVPEVNLPEHVLRLNQALELEASQDPGVREEALDLRIAIERQTEQFRRDGSTDFAAFPNRVILDRSPTVRQSPSVSMEPEPTESNKPEKSHSWRSTFRSRSGKSDDSSVRSSRTPSMITTSSASSVRTASTSASGISTSSRTTLSTVSDHGESKREENLRAGPEETHKDATRPPLAPLHRHSDSTATASDRPNLADTLVMRPRSEAKAQEVLGLRRVETAKPIARPMAEVEMSSGKYQGYWRANFATSISAAAAISASTILATAIATGGERALTINPELTERATTLRDNLDSAGSAQDTMRILQTTDLATLVFTLQCSLDSSQSSQLPAKTAQAMYQRIEEMDGQLHKAAKAWKEIAKLLKKIPEPTLVYLLFLVHIGRRLQGRKITVDRKPALVFLLQGFWPQVGTNVAHVGAGAAIAIMLLDRFEEIPDELPVGLEAVRYQFKAGGRGDLLSLIAQNRNVIEKGNRKGSTATSAS